MKLAIAGKGGVGKTTVTAGLALLLAESGEEVYAIDADPNNCLGFALGFPPELIETLQPVSDMKQLLAERAGVGPEGGTLFILTPQVNDLIDKFSLRHRGVNLLVMGSIASGGEGCACGASATLRALLREMVDLPHYVLVDLEAGVEHLGRGTAAAMETMLCITPPTPNGVRTTSRIIRLASDLGMTDVRILANLVTKPADLEYIHQALPEVAVAGALPEYEALPQEAVFDGPSGERLKADLSEVLAALQIQSQD